MAQAPNELDAVEALAAMAAGRLTAEALTRACLDRIAARDSVVRAFAFLDPERALAEARARDRAGRGRERPLHGLPFGVKDIIDTHDMPTHYGSPIHAGHRPSADAACVALAREAGAVMLGKTVTTEFALRHPGPTANPHNLAHTPGGSSSGSAAAVADFMVPVAFGTQTGGSIIRPASVLRRGRLQAFIQHDQPDRREAARRELRHGRTLCPKRRRLRVGRRRAHR